MLFVYPLGSTNKSHGPSHHFFMVFTSRNGSNPMAICFQPTCKSTLNDVWMINVTKNHLRETPGHLLENMANLGNNMAGKEGRTSFIFASACSHCRKNTFDMCVCMYTFFTVSNMNLQATKSYNFHIIKKVFHQLSDSSQCIVPIGSSESMLIHLCMAKARVTSSNHVKGYESVHPGVKFPTGLNV